MLTGPKRTVAIVFAALLAGVIVLVAATSGIGKPGLPNDDAVAFIERLCEVADADALSGRAVGDV